MMVAPVSEFPLMTARTHTPRTLAWTDDRIRRELRRFLTGRTDWPTYRDFQRAGLKSLRDNVTRRGGVRRWADEMGVTYVEHRPGYAPIWTEERVRRDLRAYLAGRDEWPSRTQFENDGLTALRNAVNRTGGVDRWAREFGLRRRNRCSGIRRAWTEELIEIELRKLIGNGKTWPSTQEFERAGLYSMLTSIYRHEGPTYWAKRMGVQQRAGFGKPRRTIWTEERIRKELDRFCAKRDLWPTEREFIDAGQRSLYSAASRAGGIPYWADRLGLPRRRVRS
jgi:hypothetical protein